MNLDGYPDRADFFCHAKDPIGGDACDLGDLEPGQVKHCFVTREVTDAEHKAGKTDAPPMFLKVGNWEQELIPLPSQPHLPL